MIRLPKTSSETAEASLDALAMPQAFPDPAAEELLAPVATPAPAAPGASTAPASGDAPAQTAPPTQDAYAEALRNGTIPSFADQPADLACDANAAPRNADAERAAWEQLLAFINAHRGAGTVVETADVDTFMHGFD